MKKINKYLMLVIVSFGLSLSACSESSNEPILDSNQSAISNYGNTLSVSSIIYDTPTEVQVAALQFMREEEKLARDVYKAMYLKYSLRVFQNISSSEQTHTNTIKLLLDKYKIEDPVSSDIPGLFKNSELQKLYNDLISKGNVSDVEALKVGAAIEEIDILDLEKHILELVNNPDILQVYTNLKNASGSHLNSFVRNLAAKGIIYSPIYLSQEEYKKIVK